MTLKNATVVATIRLRNLRTNSDYQRLSLCDYEKL
nr:MAG TPA: hypothetical protein [Caudoviricetes sp.]